VHLISLSANQESFKTVNFNKYGASFIVAKQDNPEQKDDQKTYNGVGKSLLIALVNYCLGAKPNSKISSSLQQKLPDWQFSLKIKINQQQHTIIRYTNDTKTCYLDEKKYPITEFLNQLEELCFNIPDEFQYLSFRSLLPFFIRPSKESYINYDEPVKAGKPYQKQLYNAFILGLDVNLSKGKLNLKKDLDEITKTHKIIKHDPILKQFLEGDKDSSLALADINEKVNNLDKDLKKFEVADDYYQVNQEANNIKKQLDKTHNQLILKKNNIDNIDKSLNINPDISREDIKKVYDESNLVFQLEIEKQLIDVEKFYQDLTVNRTSRLQKQKKIIKKEITELDNKFSDLKKQLDNRLKFLNAHKALDVFTNMSNQLSSLLQQRERLKSYEKLQKDFEHKKTSLQKEMLLETEKTSSYLEESTPLINNVMEYFRLLAKQFYPNSIAGITVHNNDGVNQIRYNIEAKIESDTSDGINSVKLFCYDLTLLMQGLNHSMGFIFHDSRLYSNIDEAHGNVLFEVIKQRFTGTNYQYIATVNQNQLNMLSRENQDFIEENTILSLTDDSDNGKLLGITVELEYD